MYTGVYTSIQLRIRDRAILKSFDEARIGNQLASVKCGNVRLAAFRREQVGSGAIRPRPDRSNESGPALQAGNEPGACVLNEPFY